MNHLWNPLYIVEEIVISSNNAKKSTYVRWTTLDSNLSKENIQGAVESSERRYFAPQNKIIVAMNIVNIF